MKRFIRVYGSGSASVRHPASNTENCLFLLNIFAFAILHFHVDLAHANTLNPLEKLHKHIIRNIISSPYLEHTTPLFFKLSLLEIHDICNLEIAKNMFQIKNKMTLYNNQIFCLATQMHKHHT